MAVSLLIALIGLLAVRAHYTAARRAAQIEAQHLAESIAHTIAQSADVDDGNRPELYQQPDRLQRYLSDIHRDLRRDTEVIGPDRRILADVVPRHRGEVFTRDAHGEVGATIRDGRPRSFTERSPDYPQGILQMVIPLRTYQGRIVGVVVLDSTFAVHSPAAAHAAWTSRISVGVGRRG